MDLLGVGRWRARPLHERLRPWWVYALAAVLACALAVHLLRSEAAGTDVVGGLVLALALGHARLAVVARRGPRPASAPAP